MKRNFFFIIIFIFIAPSAHAAEKYGARALSAQEIQRVRVVQRLLNGVDAKSLQQTINDLEKSRYPRINLQIREAIAKTYTDLAGEYNVTRQKKKEWLYSMVCLNMAYLQFGGGAGGGPSAGDLNRLICRKLKKYLPSNILKQHGFLYSLE